ncbi:hypothetical protein ACFWXH_22920 [Mesorhizobium sp. NPDC059054]|uniref:hypothetical protein n=1 Tax=Mesorhizobium sp. NPDC059054 TaxID=3346711 RepID=UPI0036ABBEA0
MRYAEAFGTLQGSLKWCGTMQNGAWRFRQVLRAERSFRRSDMTLAAIRRRSRFDVASLPYRGQDVVRLCEEDATVGLAAFLLLSVAALFFAPFIGHYLSPNVTAITKRLMGMILAAIAAEMIMASLKASFSGLAG